MSLLLLLVNLMHPYQINMKQQKLFSPLMIYNNNKKVPCANQHIKKIFEGSCDTEDRSDG